MFNGFTLHKDFMRVCNGYCELGGSVDVTVLRSYERLSSLFFHRVKSIIFKTMVSKIVTDKEPWAR